METGSSLVRMVDEAAAFEDAVFAVENDWSGVPRETERANLESKDGSPSCLLKAMEILYRK